MSDLAQVITAVTALIAVIVGPLVQVRIAKGQIKAETEKSQREIRTASELAQHQIRANTITAFRQQWINNLRDEIASFLEAAAMTGVLRSTRAGDATSLIEALGTLCRHESKIRMLLNPKEPDHSELVELLTDASEYAWSESANPDTLSNLRNQIIPKSQTILKREWERVKENG